MTISAITIEAITIQTVAPGQLRMAPQFYTGALSAHGREAMDQCRMKRTGDGVTGALGVLRMSRVLSGAVPL